jgi:predicted enzyme related to lactoylglutathione lyase
VQVRDLTESLQRVEALGGSVAMQPFDVPDGPRLAVITDPEDNQLVLVQQ